MPHTIAAVLLDSPLPQLDHLFDFRIPQSLLPVVRPGVRIRVPLRVSNRLVDAYVIETKSTSSFGGDLQEIESVVSEVPLLPATLFELARRVADRQAGSASDVLRLAIPPRYVRVEKAFFLPEAVDRRARVRARRAAEFAAGVPLVDKDHPLFDLPAGGCRSVLMPPGVSDEDDSLMTWALQVAQACHERLLAGESAVIVVPAYRDIDDIVAALSHCGLGDVTVRADARQSGGERYAGYLRVLEGEPLVVVGNRSAVYSPVSQLGLIVVWDDGDSLLHEPLAPYAHARDVALLRGHIARARVVLASFAPSAEAQRLVQIGFASAWSPSKKMYPRVIPTDSLMQNDNPARIPSVVWAHIREEAARGPVLVQVARAGYAPALCCSTCRVRAQCARCSGPLFTEKAGSIPTCRWCGSLAPQWSCPDCKQSKLRLVSAGSQRTAEQLGRAFPGTRIIVSDGLSPLLRVPPEPCLVVATPGAEPLAPGGYRCVVILDGEAHRSRAGLRVEEDAVRHWCNALSLVNSRATCYLVGAGLNLGNVVAAWTLRAFATSQLRQRAALGLPPARRAASIAGPRQDVERAITAVRTVGDVSVMGPSVADDTARAILLFDYRDGDEVASSLRATVITTATARPRGRTGFGSQRVVRLRVRMDDAELEDSVQ